MKWVCVLLVGAATMAGASSAPKEDTPAGSHPDREYVEKKTDKDGYELLVRVPRKSLAGHPVEAELTLANRGQEHRLIAYQRHLYRDFQVEMSDKQGKPVPLTRLGTLRIGPKLTEESYEPEKLPPGKAHRLKLNLALLFDLTVPGTYQLKVGKAYDFLKDKQTWMEVEGVEFEILEQPLEATTTTAPA